MNQLWYRKPAEQWEEALPLGNGRLGAMVFGGIDKERIQVNEESMWYGVNYCLTVRFGRRNGCCCWPVPGVRKVSIHIRHWGRLNWIITVGAKQRDIIEVWIWSPPLPMFISLWTVWISKENFSFPDRADVC